MRIAIITSEYPTEVAPQVGVFAQLTSRVLAAKHDIWVIHFVPPALDDDQVHLTDGNIRIRRFSNRLRMPKDFRDALRVIRMVAIGFDLIHTMDTNILKAFGSEPPGTVKLPCPWVHTEHSTVVSPQEWPADFPDPRSIMQGADALTVVSEQLAAEFRDSRPVLEDRPGGLPRFKREREVTNPALARSSAHALFRPKPTIIIKPTVLPDPPLSIVPYVTARPKEVPARRDFAADLQALRSIRATLPPLQPIATAANTDSAADPAAATATGDSPATPKTPQASAAHSPHTAAGASPSGEDLADTNTAAPAADNSPANPAAPAAEELLDSMAADSGPALRLIALGSLSIPNQPELALSTLAALRAAGVNANLTWMGDGPAKDRTLARARALHLAPYLRLSSFPTPAQSARALASADIFFLPTRREAFCLPALQALRYGRPVVLGPGGQGQDFLTPENSRLADSDPQQLAAAILETLLATANTSAKALAHTIPEAYSAAAIRAAYEQVYNTVFHSNAWAH